MSFFDDLLAPLTAPFNAVSDAVSGISSAIAPHSNSPAVNSAIAAAGPPPPPPPPVAREQQQASAPTASPAYTEAHEKEKEEIDQLIADEKQDRMIGKRTEQAIHKLQKRESLTGKHLNNLARLVHMNMERNEAVEAHLAYGLRRVPAEIGARVGDAMTVLQERFFRPTLEALAKAAKADPLLSAKKGEEIARKFESREFNDLRDGLRDWAESRYSFGGRLAAGGYVLGTGGILAYLNNTPAGLSSPDLRLGWTITILGALLFGRGASAWTMAAIVPAVEFFGSFISAPQGCLWGNPESASLVMPAIGTSSVAMSTAFTFTGTPVAKLWTPSSATVAFGTVDIEFQVVGGTSAGKCFSTTGVLSGTMPLSGVSTTLAGTLASILPYIEDATAYNYRAFVPYVTGTGTNAGFDTRRFIGTVAVA